MRQLDFSWGDSDAEEKALLKRIREKDYTGGFIAFLVYLAAAWYAATAASSSALALLSPPPPPPIILFLQAACAVYGLFTLHVHVYRQPYPKKDTPELFGNLAGPCGRWVYLTRQTLTLQALHLSLSLVAPFVSLRLTVGTYALAVYVGGQATFVTIQFYTMVLPQEEYKKVCATWASRGMNFQILGKLTHTPGLILTIADICVLKNRTSLLQSTLPIPIMLILLSFYCVLYLSLLFVTYGVTGQWPYAFLYKFGKSIGLWSKFVAVQLTTTMIFCLAVLAMSRAAPVSW